MRHDAPIQLHELASDDGEAESALGIRGGADGNAASGMGGLVQYGARTLKRMFTRDSKNPSLTNSGKQGSSPSSFRPSDPARQSSQGASAKQSSKQQ